MPLSLEGHHIYARMVTLRLELCGDTGGEELCSQEHDKGGGRFATQSYTPFGAACIFEASWNVLFHLGAFRYDYLLIDDGTGAQ